MLLIFVSSADEIVTTCRSGKQVPRDIQNSAPIQWSAGEPLPCGCSKTASVQPSNTMIMAHLRALLTVSLATGMGNLVAATTAAAVYMPLCRFCL